MEKTSYTYKSVLEEYGLELAEKYLNYQNEKERKMKELFDEVATHKVMGEFFDKLNEITGMKLSYSFEIKKDRYGKEYISYTSNNIAVDNPVINLAWEKMVINNFNHGNIWAKEFGVEGAEAGYYSGTYDAKDIDYEKPVVVGFGIDIHYSYCSHRGGSNGTELGYARYENGSWSIELCKNK